VRLAVPHVESATSVTALVTCFALDFSGRGKAKVIGFLLLLSIQDFIQAKVETKVSLVVLDFCPTAGRVHFCFCFSEIKFLFQRKH
jgi:hypothetical protein